MNGDTYTSRGKLYRHHTIYYRVGWLTEMSQILVALETTT